MICSSGFVDDVTFSTMGYTALATQLKLKLKVTHEVAARDRGRSLTSTIALIYLVGKAKICQNIKRLIHQ